MGFEFDPTFSLLPKFTIGLRPMPTSEAEVKQVSRYLGVDLRDADLETSAKELCGELEAQNVFLTKNLESDAITETPEYSRSMFIRDIVANNRHNRMRRLATKT